MSNQPQTHTNIQRNIVVRCFKLKTIIPYTFARIGDNEPNHDRSTGMSLRDTGAYQLHRMTSQSMDSTRCPLWSTFIRCVSVKLVITRTSTTKHLRNPAKHVFASSARSPHCCLWPPRNHTRCLSASQTYSYVTESERSYSANCTCLG